MVNRLAQRLYWGLPYQAKCWAASLMARRWDRERHGVEFERCLAGIRERDGWSRSRLEEYQREQLHFLVREAAAHVPYYRRAFAEAGIGPESISDVSDLRRLPILDKATLREQGSELLDDRADRSGLIEVETSGTTGSPLVLLNDVQTNSARYAYVEGRCHAVAGLARRRDPSASIGGHLVTAPHRNRPPYWVENHRWQQLYMSSYHLAERHLGHYVEALRRFAPAYLEGYPSSLYALARFIIDHDLEPIRLAACFTTAETLFDHQRQALRQAFGCPTFDHFGCAELVVFAAECGDGSMHLSPEVGIVEVLDEQDRPLPAGKTGRLVCTGLINRVQPLIRYRLGDLASLESDPCSCGSALPILRSIEGREDQVLLTKDGRLIGRLDPVFKGMQGITEAQIVQDDLSRFRIRVVPSPGWAPEVGRRLLQRLTDRLGNGCRIELETVEQIPRSRAGKFEAVVCNLAPEVRRQVFRDQEERDAPAS